MSKIESVEMYSKPQCPFCVKAKDLLNQNDISFDEYEVGVSVTKQDIQSRVDAMGLDITISTVPQIFAQLENKNDWAYIGGYVELRKFLSNH